MKSRTEIISTLSDLGYSARETSEGFRHGYTNGSMAEGRGEIAIYDDAMGGWYAYDRSDAEQLVEALESAETDAERYDAYSEWCSSTSGVAMSDDEEETASPLGAVIKVPAEHAYRAFRYASMGGGTPPQWTQCGDDPANWKAPADAAGGLILYHEDGSLDRLEPSGRVPVEEDGEIARRAIEDMRDRGLPSGIVRAAYFSCGGRSVALLEDLGAWTIAIIRDGETEPRLGASGENVLFACPGATVLTPTQEATHE